LKCELIYKIQNCEVYEHGLADRSMC